MLSGMTFYRYQITSADVATRDYGGKRVTTPQGRLSIARLLGRFELSDVGRIIVYQCDPEGKPNELTAYLSPTRKD